LVVILSPRRPGFDPRPVHVMFVFDKVALGQVFLGSSVLACHYHSTKCMGNFVFIPLSEGRRTSGRSLEMFRVMLSLISDGTGHCGFKPLHVDRIMK
jgi:hypothetical protein